MRQSCSHPTVNVRVKHTSVLIVSNAAVTRTSSAYHFIEVHPAMLYSKLRRGGNISCRTVQNVSLIFCLHADHDHQKLSGKYR